MSKTTMFKRLGMGLALAVLSLALVACGGNDDDNKDEPAAPSVVTGGQLSGMADDSESGITSYGTTNPIQVKGLESAAAYTAGGDSETKFAMKLFPANNDGQVTIDVTSTDATVDATALALVTAKYTGGNLVISFGAEIDGTKIEGKVLQATAKVGEKSLFVLNFKVVAPDDFITPIVEAFTVADFGVDAANATVQTIVLAAKDAADLNKGYAEGSHSFALTLTGTGAYLGAKVSRVEGDSFNTKVVVDGEDYAVVISTDQVGKSATYSIAPVAPQSDTNADPLPAVFVKVKSVGPVPKVTVADVEITTVDGTADAVITFLPAALTAGTAAYDTTAHDLFTVVDPATGVATVTVTNSKVEGTADAIVVKDASGKTAKATVTVYVVPQSDTALADEAAAKAVAYSSTTFEVSVALDPTTAVDDANAILNVGYEAILPLNKGGVDPDPTDVIVATVTLKGETETPNGIEATAVTVDEKGAFTGTEGGIYEDATHLAVTLPAAGADFDNIEADQVYVVTVQVVTPVTDGDDVVRSTDTFELTIKPIATVTADDVKIELATGSTVTATLVKTDYDVDPAFYSLSVSVTGGTDISVALDPAVPASGDAAIAAAIDAATGVKITVGDNDLTDGDEYTVTISVLDSTDGDAAISTSTFTVTATEPNVTAEDLSIPLAKDSTVTAPITKEFYDAATHSLEVTSSSADITVALDPDTGDDAAKIDAATGVKITVDNAAGLIAGTVYTVTLTVKDSSSDVSERTFKVVAASADDLKATVTAADVDLKKDAASVLTLPVVKTDYVADRHSLSVAVTDAAGTGAAVGDITATLDPAGDDATAVKLVVAKELVGVYTVTLTVVLEGTDVVVSTHDITVTAAAESTVTAAANVADAATDIAKASGTLILPLVKTGSYVGTETLTAAIAVTTDQGTVDADASDITVTLASDDAGIAVGSDLYKDSTHIKLVTAADLDANDVYTVTLTVSDSGGTTIGTPTEFTVTVEPVSVTAANVAIDKTAAATTTATATLTKTNYVDNDYDLLVAVTDATGTDAVVGDITATLDSAGDAATAVNLEVKTARAAGTVYTVTLYVVAEGESTVDADEANVISKSTFTVTAVDEATLTATATVAADVTDMALTDTSVDVDVTKTNYAAATHDLLVAVTAAATTGGDEIASGNYKMVPSLATTDADAVTLTSSGMTDGDVYTVTIYVVLEGDTVVADATVINTDTFEVTAASE